MGEPNYRSSVTAPRRGRLFGSVTHRGRGRAAVGLRRSHTQGGRPVSPQKLAQAAGHAKPSVHVENARKMSGTMKASSSKTVISAINYVVANLNYLTVKRKFQAHNGTAKKWWHVVPNLILTFLNQNGVKFKPKLGGNFSPY